jgi:hypothetical protein
VSDFVCHPQVTGLNGATRPEWRPLAAVIFDEEED